MAKEHTCNSDLQSTIDYPLGSTSDGKGIVYNKQRRTWCSECGGNSTTEDLGTYEAR